MTDLSDTKLLVEAGLDDGAIAREAAAEVLDSRPQLGGLYHCGGGVEGVCTALGEAGLAREVFYICHEPSPRALTGLQDGTVDAIIANPLAQIAQCAVETMAHRVIGRAGPGDPAPLPFHLITSENIPP